MAYKVSKTHGVLATRFGSWAADAPLTNTNKIPPTVLKSWLEKGVIIMDESGPDTNEILEEDVLSHLSRKELLQTIVANAFQSQIVVKTSWTDEAIRQAIRDISPDLSLLKLPNSPVS